MSKETRTRTMVGILLGALAVWMLFGIGVKFLIGAFCLLAWLGWSEYLKIFEIPRKSLRAIAGLLAIWIAMVESFLSGNVEIRWIWIFWVLSLFFLVVESMSKDQAGKHDLSALLREYAFFFTGLLYIFFLFCFAGPLLQSATPNYGRGVIFLTFVVVFSGDIAAYMVGRKFGKRPLWPRVSPKKTIEGAIAGLVGSAVGAAVFTYVWYSLGMTPLPIVKIIIFVIFAAPLAQGGDFLESFFKRVSGVKDSGAWLPGHGGLLDRIDGLAFTLPLAYFIFI